MTKQELYLAIFCNKDSKVKKTNKYLKERESNLCFPTMSLFSGSLLISKNVRKTKVILTVNFKKS